MTPVLAVIIQKSDPKLHGPISSRGPSILFADEVRTSSDKIELPQELFVDG
ncbi:hypothetical protein I6F35_37270 [Bradyrhizobium sp. BRP22]|uniref:hypothetical protein n=1 Tax=Bradyrhizobium sp. BRP22 TaxID=2793821 RepID=UPI001CD3D05B|nr:hypothetical protein [Bradyrhizobium sp. BRP22]MCA1458756.1 hypothetical protein [Bradyrhizobium sp. BRP22]